MSRARKARFRSGLMCLAAVLSSSCGGGGSGQIASGPVAPPPPTSNGCSLLERQNFAGSVLNEWYLFPETLPSNLSPSGYATVDDYIDALTATARSQRRDRFFTYRTSIAEEDAFFNSGASAGFGIRISTDTVAGRLFVSEAFEGAPALAAGIDRGTEILAIGPNPAGLRNVSDIFASEGAAGITNALGPSTAGTTRSLRIQDASGVREVTVTKANYDITPISARYGVRIINDGGRMVGYLNMRTFISTANNQLRTAFDQFRQAGITDFVIDLRYNGGGLVSTAELMGDLLGGNRIPADVFSQTTYRTSKASNNTTRRFAPQSQSVSPLRIAFIATNGTASASELVINSMIPYLGVNLALVGSNSFGKPVGQIALDRAACDDRIRVVAFSTQNSANAGFYYDGLSGVVRSSCQAGDDLTRPLGDAQESSVAQALDFLAGRGVCTPIAAGGLTGLSVRGGRKLLTPDAPTVSQREVTGLF